MDENSCRAGRLWWPVAGRSMAIMLSIDQYAESALGNREYFLNKPHSIGGKGDKIP